MPVYLPASISQDEVTNARLPANYIEAKAALAACADIDEVLSWKNKATALASYARQAQDTTLEDFASRIKARAVRRVGEILKEFDGRGKRKNDGGDVFSRTEVADKAGLSERQRIQAVRVAAVPEQDFEEAVEAEEPMTIEQIAQMGRRKPYRARERVNTLTEDRIADMSRDHRSAEIVKALLQIEHRADEVDPADVIDLLLDERNEHYLPRIQTALEFVVRMKQVLDKKGVARKSTLQLV